MKLIKVILSALVIAVLAFAVAATLLVTLVDPNTFKKEIAQYVSDKAGRTLEIRGSLHWSLFPWLGIRVTEVSLGNPAGFDGKPFAEIGEADVRVRVLPLFEKRIEIGRISLKDATVNLIKKANGDTNWQGLLAPRPPVSAPPAPPPTAAAAPMQMTLSAIEINNATLHWQDAQTGLQADISGLSLQGSDIALGRAFPLSARLAFRVNTPALAGTLTVKTRVLADPVNNHYVLESLALGLAVPKENLTATLAADIDIDLAKETARLDNLIVNVNNNRLQGSAQLAQILHKVVLWNLAAKAQTAQLKTQALQAKNLDLTLKTAAGTLNTSPFGVTVQTLEGAAHAESVQAGAIVLSNLNATLRGKDNRYTVSPFTATLFQGDAQGQLSADLSQRTPRLSVVTTLKNAQAKAIFDALAPNARIKIAGLVDFNAHLQTQGIDQGSILRSLNGDARFAFQNGVITNINVHSLVDNALLGALHQASANPAQNQTEFSSLSASFGVRNGVANNNDLLLTSPLLTAKGQGTLDLVNNRIDYRLQVTLKAAQLGQEILQAQEQLGGSVDMRVTGTLTDPHVAPDVSALARGIVKQQIKKIIDKNIGEGVGKAIFQILGQ